MDAFKKNALVAKLASDKHFDKDKEHFKKVFPASPLIPELERAQAFNKKALDERMLYELLNHVCEETILEFRGILPKEDKDMAALNDKIAAQKRVLNAENVSEFSYKEMKEIAKALTLDTPDQKKDTLISAIESYKEAMSDEGGDDNDTSDEEGVVVTGEDTDASAPALNGQSEDDKKKEAPGLSTQA